MYPNRELFPQSPLALVAAEVRFTDSARLRQQATRDAIALALEDELPFADAVQTASFSLNGPASPPETSLVLKNDKTTASITLASSSLIFETTDYGEFPELVRIVGRACQALLDAHVRPAIRRIGLRYIDEIRVPEPIDDARQWGKWIDHRLIDHLSVGTDGLRVRETQGVTTFDLDGGLGLLFRYAAFPRGAVVQPTMLQRPHTIDDSRPLFVLDFDGFQDFAGHTPVSLNADVVRQSLEAVHAPAGTAFQGAITDLARKLFRGEHR